VHTETPRPEKLVLDYDTTVKNDGRAADISGSGNDGFYYGHAYYSAPDKAFKFDGTGDTVYVDTNGNIADTNLPTGDAIYTMSCWIKANTAQYGYAAAVFYFGSAWTTSQLAGIYHDAQGGIHLDIGGINLATATGTIQSNRWYHVAVVKRGTGAITAAHSYGSIYIDGQEIPHGNLTITNSGTQALQSIDNISIGLILMDHQVVSLRLLTGLFPNPKYGTSASKTQRSKSCTDWAEPGGPWSSATRPSGSGKSPKRTWM